jgi:hypothetical protein
MLFNNLWARGRVSSTLALSSAAMLAAVVACSDDTSDNNPRNAGKGGTSAGGSSGKSGAGGRPSTNTGGSASSTGGNSAGASNQVGGASAGGTSKGGSAGDSGGQGGEAGEAGKSTAGNSSTAGAGGNTSAPGAVVDNFKITYYWFLWEEDFGGAQSTQLVDASCKPLVNVRKDFADSVCLEGSGKLLDGKGINLEGTCSCGYACGDEGKVCFFTYNLATAPWGLGSSPDIALVPLRSVAMNRDELKNKSVYLKVFDGVSMSSLRGVGGFVHDGCFRVDDESYSFGAEGVDIFVGPKQLYPELEGKAAESNTDVEVRAGGERCKYLEK